MVANSKSNTPNPVETPDAIKLLQQIVSKMNDNKPMDDTSSNKKTNKDGVPYAEMSRLKRKSHSVKCHYDKLPHNGTYWWSNLYFWSCGYDISSNHTSANSKFKKDRHKYNVTIDKRIGGRNKNVDLRRKL